MEKKQTATVVQTPLGLTEQNSPSDNLETVAFMFAFAIIAVVILAVWLSYRVLSGKPSSPCKKVDRSEPVETDKVPLYSESD